MTLQARTCTHKKRGREGGDLLGKLPDQIFNIAGCCRTSRSQHSAVLADQVMEQAHEGAETGESGDKLTVHRTCCPCEDRSRAQQFLVVYT